MIGLRQWANGAGNLKPDGSGATAAMAAYVMAMRRIERRNGVKSGTSNVAAIASRQRDWRINAKSEIASRPSASAVSWPRRSRPLPLQRDPSTISRSAMSVSSRVTEVPNAGSPGTHSVTGRSWISNGAVNAWK